MTLLFERGWTLQIGTLDLSNFDFRFRIEKTLDPKPNKALIEVYNLSVESMAALSEQASGSKPSTKKGLTAPAADGSIPVRLEVGYKEKIDLIYLGALRKVTSEFNGSDWVTSVNSGDGEKELRTARCNLSFGPKVPLEVALTAVLKTLGLGLGNLATVKKKLQSGSLVLSRGAVFSGPTARAITDICRSADLEWCVEDGYPTFVDLNKALTAKAVVLTPSTGLIGSPVVDAAGKLTCQSLIIPGLRCGRLVQLSSAMVKGQYRIEKLTYDGDTSGNNWYATIEGTRY